MLRSSGSGRVGRYGLAVVLPLVLAGVRLVGEPLLGQGDPLTLFYAGIVVVAIAGLGPALLATAVSALSAMVILRPPQGAPDVSEPDVLGIVLFVGVCALIAFATVRFRDAHADAERSRRVAERAAERTSAALASAEAARLETEAALAEARASAARAEGLLRIREGFGSMLAHEVRTPVTVILGDAHLLGRPGLPEGTAHELVEDMRLEAERLHRLIEDLLVLNRGDELLEITPEPLALPALVQHFAQSELGDARTDVELRIEHPVPLVAGDATYVQQILRNLVSNARKYAGDSGVTLVVGGDGACGRLSVLDHGPGIEPGEEGRLFDPFVRGARAAGKPGAGVGLYVCRRLAEAMGGRIWVERREPRGVAFHLELPAFVEG